METKRRKYVRTRVWDIELAPDFFPERDDPDLAVPGLERRSDLGVCFSGGGTRSASATLGQLRGLRASRLLGKVRYIVAVSGGAWAATPYTFLPREFSDDIFLGPVVAPQNLTDEHLRYAPAGSLARAISKSVVIDHAIQAWLSLSGDEAYARVIGDIFLKPFRLNNRAKFFTWSARSRSAILANNHGSVSPKHYLKASDFYLARPNRPYFIAGATLLHRKLVVPMEITPLYVGARQRLCGQGKRGRDIGGCYVEPFAYDSKLDDDFPPENPLTVKLWGSASLSRRRRYLFTLPDLVGTSGAAPAAAMYKAIIGRAIGFPEFRHWSWRALGKGHAEYSHGDGGHADNLGIMPLLARQVKNIIVFVNSRREFNLSAKDKRYDRRLSALFGVCGTPVPEGVSSAGPDVANQVFERRELPKLLNVLHRCREDGKSLIHMASYAVRENPRYRIRPYSGVKVVWIYNSDVPAWRERLTDAVPASLRTLHKRKEFRNFPNYKTFGDRRVKVIDLSKRQVNALAHLSCWNVTENASSIKSFFAL